jgi:hypothetical protein
MICLVVSRQQAAAVAGVYYVTMTNGYNFVANQLNATDALGATNNSLTNVVIAPPEGTKAYQWDVTNQVFLLPATYHTNGGWNATFDCPPGKGFVIFSTSSQWSNTFVGQVPSGLLTNFVPGGNNFSLLASMIPLAGHLTADLGFPGTDGDNVYLWRSLPQTYFDAFTYFTNYTWFDPRGAPGPSDPVLNVGESFFVQNPGFGTNWTVNFAPFLAGPTGGKSLTTNGPPTIRRISVRAGKTALDVVNPGGSAYKVQFSSDGSTWRNVATGQTSTVWTGAYPGGVRAYYQLVRP